MKVKKFVKSFISIMIFFPLGILMIQKQHMKKMLTVVCLSL